VLGAIGQDAEPPEQRAGPRNRVQRYRLGGEAPLEVLAAAEEIDQRQALVDRPLDVVHHQHHARRGPLMVRVIGGDERHHPVALHQIDRDRDDAIAAFEQEDTQDAEFRHHADERGESRRAFVEQVRSMAVALEPFALEGGDAQQHGL